MSLAARVQVSALIRMAEAAGGTGAVIARGDPQAGAILLWLAERGAVRQLLGRRLDPAGFYRWEPVGPQDVADLPAVHTYLERRRTADPDLWVVELDVAGAERFAAQLAALG